MIINHSEYVITKKSNKTGISTEPQATQGTRFLMQGIMHSVNCDIIKINHFI